MRALIIIGPGVEDSEFLCPYYRLQEADIPTDVAGPKVGSIQGKHGYDISANLAFAQINPDNYHVLIIPGGKGPETVRLSEHAVSITKRMVEGGKLVAAICHGAQVLISANVLHDRCVTCWAGIRDDVMMAGADYRDEEVVVDGNLITSRCPDDLPAFCREIINSLE